MHVSPFGVKKLLRPGGIGATGCGLALALALAACDRPAPAPAQPASQAAAPAASDSSPARSSAIDRGKYLVTLGACSECHNPLRMGANGPEPDPSRYLAGHPEGEVVDPPPPKTEHSTSGCGRRTTPCSSATSAPASRST